MKIVNENTKKVFLVEAFLEYGEERKTITRKEIKALVAKRKLAYPNWLTHDEKYRAGRGEYFLVDKGEKVPMKEKIVKKTKTRTRKFAPAPMTVVPVHSAAVPVINMAASASPVATESEVSLVPDPAHGYVPFGYYTDVKAIVKSSMFYPVYVTGLSGNGKTMMIEQIHADLKKEMIRVNITIETDEDDLIGGFRLVDGHTVWQNGPVIVAMLRGCTLLLDEVDLGSNKLMCLQPILEGKGIFLKKINKMIRPAPGFNVIATANTKGKGSDDGRFIGTNVLNEAFLERFSITLEQEYPSSKVETKILENIMEEIGVEDSQFVNMLVMWAEIVRETFRNGGISEIISTRRLVHICQAYGIFKQDRKKALTLCLNRFDDDTKLSMMQLYEKVDETINPIITPQVSTVSENTMAEPGFDRVPF